MTNKKILLIAILLMIPVAIWLVMSATKSQGELKKPGFLQQILGKSATAPAPESITVPDPPQAPKTFKFDSTTDLKTEFEKVNPLLLDSDFE